MATKKQLSRIAALLLVLAMLIASTACGGPQASESQTPPTTVEATSSNETTNTESSTQEPANNPVVVTDQLGRQVTIEGEVNKIVSGYYISTSLLIALGLEEKIVGVEAKANSRPIYSLSAPQILDLPNVGTAKQFDLEGCLALKPDLVILPVKLKDSIESLEKSGINVLGVNPEDMELLKEAITLIGKATGTEERASKLIEYYDTKINEISNITKDSGTPKSIYLAGNSAMLSTATSKMYQNSLIETAGGKNVASDITDTYWATISYEQLLSYNPDVIIIVPFAEYTKDDVLNDSKLKSLNAIKSKSVYKMPDTFEAWDSPVPSGILGTMWLTSILHEDKYSFDEFKSDAAAFYKEYYDFEINSEDITK